MKKIVIAILCFLEVLALSSCSQTLEEYIESKKTTDNQQNITQALSENAVFLASDLFSGNDKEIGYDLNSATVVSLNNENLNITTNGTYVVSGELSNGQIVVDIGDEGEVQLVLDNVNISSSTTAPIYVKSAKNVFVTLSENSNNILTVNGEYSTSDDNIDSVIFSKSDITFNGNGTLNINANYGHGIVGKDDVVFTSGIYNINSQNHGINANDSVRLTSSTFKINSGKDAIRAENIDDLEKGYIYIENGTFEITAQQDAFDCSSTLQIDAGTFNILSGGGFTQILNSITVGEGAGGTVQPSSTLEHSMKGLKGLDIIINGGDINISSYEDGIHANNDLIINNATIKVYSGDDAIHADENLIINSGKIEVVEAYEGIEANQITINGGDVSVIVLDDAINASQLLTINSGVIYVQAQGDGIDSNGDFVMTGGDITFNVNAIHVGGDGNVDVSSQVTYTGGTLKDIDGNEIDPTEKLQGGGGRGDFGERPEGMLGERPEGMFGERPEGMFGERPEGMFGERPEGMFGERPEGMLGERPENNNLPQQPLL